jgi:hypothetical protein
VLRNGLRRPGMGGRAGSDFYQLFYLRPFHGHLKLRKREARASSSSKLRERSLNLQFISTVDLAFEIKIKCPGSSLSEY